MKMLCFFKDFQNNSNIKYIFSKFDAQYNIVDNINNKFIVVTNLNSPNRKIILVDPNKPDIKNWKEIIPETGNVIQSVSYVGGKLIINHLKDASSFVTVTNINGEQLYDLELPGIGSVSGFGGKKDQTEVFYTFTSFTYPPTIFKYNVENNKSELFRKSEVKFTPKDYETKQVFYKSKDGTAIPLFITHKKRIRIKR